MMLITMQHKRKHKHYKHCTTQCNTTLHNTTQHSTAQHSTTQHKDDEEEMRSPGSVPLLTSLMVPAGPHRLGQAVLVG